MTLALISRWLGETLKRAGGRGDWAYASVEWERGGHGSIYILGC